MRNTHNPASGVGVVSLSSPQQARVRDSAASFQANLQGIAELFQYAPITMDAFYNSVKSISGELLHHR